MTQHAKASSSSRIMLDRRSGSGRTFRYAYDDKQGDDHSHRHVLECPRRLLDRHRVRVPGGEVQGEMDPRAEVAQSLPREQPKAYEASEKPEHP